MNEVEILKLKNTLFKIKKFTLLDLALDLGGRKKGK
jgi:hypothetical protein